MGQRPINSQKVGVTFVSRASFLQRRATAGEKGERRDIARGTHLGRSNRSQLPPVQPPRLVSHDGAGKSTSCQKERVVYTMRTIVKSDGKGPSEKVDKR